MQFLEENTEVATWRNVSVLSVKTLIPKDMECGMWLREGRFRHVILYT